jgi:hypothetical protein
MDGHAELLASGTQDRQESLAADRREAVPARREDLSVEMHVDVIPDGEINCEPLVKGGVGLFNTSQRLV